jgi:hypothetical protein
MTSPGDLDPHVAIISLAVPVVAFVVVILVLVGLIVRDRLRRK